MVRKVFSLIIIYCFCIQAPFAVAQSGQVQLTKEARQAEKIKKLVFKSSIGPGNDIEVKLRNKTMIRGYISEIANNYFVVTNPQTGATTKLEYSQVEKARLWSFAKNDFERNSPSPARIFRNVAVGFGLAVFAVGVICMASRRCEN